MGTQRMTLLEYCEQNPDMMYLLDEWDYENNGDLDPATIGFKANKTIAWYLPYDDPKTGKHHDFRWEARVIDRIVVKTGCPYLTGKLWPNFNDLACTHPEIATQWNYERNSPLTPQDVKAGWHQKVWWKYECLDLNGELQFIEWEDYIDYRTKKNIIKPNIVKKFEKELGVWDKESYKQSLKSKYQKLPEHLLKEWHWAKNVGLDPFHVNIEMKNAVWWYLPYDDPKTGKHYDFEWKATIKKRIEGEGCHQLIGKVYCKGINDLATTHPELAAEWHPTLNGDLKPDDVMATDQRSVYWYVSYDDPVRGHHDLEWDAKVYNRTIRGNGCPYLSKSNPRVKAGLNDFATTHPELCKEWHPTKNLPLTPQDVSHGYRYNVWWLLEFDDPITGKHHRYEWEARIPDRINKKRGCPQLHNSFGEQQIADALDKYRIFYKGQYNKFKDRRRPRRHSQPLKDDFMILDENENPIAAIEYHGQQHYYCVPCWSKIPEQAPEDLLDLQERDALKTKYLEEHGIPQLIIPYWEYDNIEYLVTEYLKELNLI